MAWIKPWYHHPYLKDMFFNKKVVLGSENDNFVYDDDEEDDFE